MGVAELFDDWAARGRAEGMERGHLETAGPVLAEMPWGADKRILDLGCGNAWASRWAIERGAQAVAVDLSSAMVSKAYAHGVAATRADMQALPFRDASFDHVWSMEALYYAPDPDRVLAEVHRVLGHGGRVHILIDFYEENVESHSWPGDVGVAMSLRSEATWVAALIEAGFADVASRRLLASADKAAWKREEGSLLLSGRKA